MKSHLSKSRRRLGVPDVEGAWIAGEALVFGVGLLIEMKLEKELDGEFLMIRR